MIFDKIKVYAFVGPSGTGKSYRAQMVASEKKINFIIDDGLLIKDNEIVAGLSAKKAPTKIETVKHALFLSKEEQQQIQKALKKYKEKVDAKDFKIIQKLYKKASGFYKVIACIICGIAVRLPLEKTKVNLQFNFLKPSF